MELQTSKAVEMRHKVQLGKILTKACRKFADYKNPEMNYSIMISAHAKKCELVQNPLIVTTAISDEKSHQLNWVFNFFLKNVHLSKFAKIKGRERENFASF